MKFNKLDVPYQWKDEFTKYPHGYTIFEALCSWTKQVDKMVDNINDWNDYLDKFVENFEFELQEEVKSTITRWQNEGLLDDIIASALTTEIDDVKAQLAEFKNYFEIEPDSLRESETETDGDLLNKAFSIAENSRETVSIKLGRIYKIDKPISLTTSISYKKEPHIIIKGYGGGLSLAYDGFMFDGVKNSGGLHFQNVKFSGDDVFTHALFNNDNLIQIVFNGCQFFGTHTILFADETNGYIQSCRFIGCNFKGMRDYQIKAAMVYDLVINSNIVEWGAGGLINLTQPSTSQYCSMGMFITNNVIEGISEQSPIKTTHNGRALIANNYFEGNSMIDIDMSGAVLPHRGISIKDNLFGNYPTTLGKDCCVKVGPLYAGQGYDFSGNSGSMLIFDFTGSNGRYINMTGGVYLFNGKANYRGIDSKHIVYGQLPSTTVTNKSIVEVDHTSSTTHSFTVTLDEKGVYLVTLKVDKDGDDNQICVGTWLVKYIGGKTFMVRTADLIGELEKTGIGVLSVELSQPSTDGVLTCTTTLDTAAISRFRCDIIKIG